MSDLDYGYPTIRRRRQRNNANKALFVDFDRLAIINQNWLFSNKKVVFVFLFVLFYLPFLSSIHEKANCIAILWTGSPHSLGSCLFRGLWATCLSHKGGGVPLSALPKDTTSELAGLFSTTSHKCRAPSREAIDTIF